MSKVPILTVLLVTAWMALLTVVAWEMGRAYEYPRAYRQAVTDTAAAWQRSR